MSYLILVAAVLVAVMLHRASVTFVYWRIRRQRASGIEPRHQMASILLLIGAHIGEVVLFAMAIAGIVALGDGGLRGVAAPGFLDHLYFSFSVYSSLGFGDLVPTGDLRIVAGVEVIVGLLLIAWSATVVFSEVFLPAVDPEHRQPRCKREEEEAQ